MCDYKCSSGRNLGMISHKMSLKTIFGHKHKIFNFIKKFEIFHKKFDIFHSKFDIFHLKFDIFHKKIDILHKKLMFFIKNYQQPSMLVEIWNKIANF